MYICTHSLTLTTILCPDFRLRVVVKFIAQLTYSVKLKAGKVQIFSAVCKAHSATNLNTKSIGLRLLCPFRYLFNQLFRQTTMSKLLGLLVPRRMDVDETERFVDARFDKALTVLETYFVCGIAACVDPSIEYDQFD